MASKPAHTPEGFHTATPYLIVTDGAGAIEFYKNVFGATEVMREADSSGKVRHAQIKIGNSPVMLGEHQNAGAHGPGSLPPVSIYGSAREFGEVINWRRFQRFALPGLSDTMAQPLSRRCELENC